MKTSFPCIEGAWGARGVKPGVTPRSDAKFAQRCARTKLGATEKPPMTEVFQRLLRKLRIVIALLTLLSVGIVWAESAQLRVLDRSGLTRLVAPVDRETTVTVTLSQDASGALGNLVHVDGLSPEKRAVQISPREIRFQKVPPGTWQLSIHSSNPAVQVHTVRAD